MFLAGKKIVVVGGSSGIGLATAEMAKREGADVIVASRDVERLDKVAEKLNAIAIPTDVTSDGSVAKLFQACGPIDHVVVTAAQLRTGPFKSVAMDDVRATMESKFWGAWRVARSAEIRAGGSLTLVTGYLSTRPRPGAAIVGAVNGALESLTKGLALELAPVRVNAVSPGTIDTPIRASMPEAAGRDMLAKPAASLPVCRVGASEDIAQQILTFMTVSVRPDRSSISMAARSSSELYSPRRFRTGKAHGTAEGLCSSRLDAGSAPAVLQRSRDRLGKLPQAPARCGFGRGPVGDHRQRTLDRSRFVHIRRTEACARYRAGWDRRQPAAGERALGGREHQRQ